MWVHSFVHGNCDTDIVPNVLRTKIARKCRTSFQKMLTCLSILVSNRKLAYLCVRLSVRSLTFSTVFILCKYLYITFVTRTVLTHDKIISTSKSLIFIYIHIIYKYHHTIANLIPQKLAEFRSNKAY